MPIHYRLYQNRLVAADNVYAARVQTTGTMDLPALTDFIVNQGTTVRRADVMAVLENLCQACESLLLMGQRIQLGGVCALFPLVKGKFDGPTDSFDPGRHRLDAGAIAGQRLRRILHTRGEIAKATGAAALPDLLQYEDLASGAIDGQVSPGGLGVISGRRLKFDPAAADEGLFFIDADTGDALPATVIQRNSPGQLVFQAPDLPPTRQWLVEVRNRYRPQASLRRGRLRAALHSPAAVAALV